MSELTALPKRPTIFDDRCIDRAVQLLLPKVLEWYGDRADRESITKDLTDALHDILDFDGYALAKWLDSNCFWDADSDLVEILDLANGHLHDSTYFFVKEWVKEHHVTAGHKIGDTVRWKAHDGVKEGKIRHIYADLGEYAIQPPPPAPQTRQPIVHFEDVLGDQPWGTQEGANASA